jgi:dipeptidase D
MNDLKKLSPHSVWELFDEITRVPRPSKKEEKIVAWLIAFAGKHDLQYRKDDVGNVVIVKPASPGMEGRPAVVLQNHVDMVCEKNSDVVCDFERDPIHAVITPDGWVKAEGTTLGADNGLGMAAALALLIDPEAVHPALEALFTVDEETGLTGAFNLGKGTITGTALMGSGMITGKYLINLDSEDEGEVFIGCAGGVDTLAYFDYTTESLPAGYKFFEIAVSGLKGGHSGDDIEKGHGNSNKILARALWAATAAADKNTVSGPGFGLRLAGIDGGNLRNAIPREARAVVAVPEAKAAGFWKWFENFAADIRGELQYSDPGVALKLEKTEAAKTVVDADTTRRLVSALVGVPNGVQAMSFAMPGLVETSTNLASVKMADGQIVVTTSQRSSVESAKKATAATVEAVFTLAGARVEHSDGYPGWTPDPSSHLLEVTKKAYETLFGEPIKVRAIHAGLECGLFLEKYPHLEMVSTGPTILGAHSPDERLEIATVDKFWKLLLEILKTL